MNYQVPYDFVLRLLYPIRPSIRKMLGGYALHYNNKWLLFLRDKETQPEFNGVFVATQPEHFADMQQAIHHSKMEFDLDGSYDSWIFISEDLPDFETIVAKACALIKSGDERIGK
jgi:hypothetical protein